MNEHEFTWREGTDLERKATLISHSIGLMTPIDTLEIIFDLTNPKVIIGDDLKTSRIHPDSIDVFRVAIRQYG